MVDETEVLEEEVIETPSKKKFSIVTLQFIIIGLLAVCVAGLAISNVLLHRILNDRVDILERTENMDHELLVEYIKKNITATPTVTPEPTPTIVEPYSLDSMTANEVVVELERLIFTNPKNKLGDDFYDALAFRNEPIRCWNGSPKYRKFFINNTQENFTFETVVGVDEIERINYLYEKSMGGVITKMNEVYCYFYINDYEKAKEIFDIFNKKYFNEKEYDVDKSEWYIENNLNELRLNYCGYYSFELHIYIN